MSAVNEFERRFTLIQNGEIARVHEPDRWLGADPAEESAIPSAGQQVSNVTLLAIV